MAGRYGAERVTTANIEVVAVRPEENLLLVRGAVPGARNGTVIVRRPRSRKAAESRTEVRS
jgi:large subunit ribosomal protein L3